MTINMEDLTIAQARGLVDQLHRAGYAPFGYDDFPWRVGACYLIRTVTMIDTGRLVRVGSSELVLEDAAWIADTGRFADALKSLDFVEVEPFPDGHVIVGRGAVIDAVEIASAPRTQK